VTAEEAFVVSRAFRQIRTDGAVPLPEASPRAGELADIMAERRSARELQRPVSLADLATVLQQALAPNSVTVDGETGGTTMARAWPSAGGLYPLDVYVVAQQVTGLNPGCFHANLIARQLEPIAAAPVIDVLRDGFFWQEFVTTAAAVVLLVAVFERSIAKYGERGYRFCLLDAGHAAQNVLLVAEQQKLRAVSVGGFDDDELAAHLRIDGVHEAVVESMAIGGR